MQNDILYLNKSSFQNQDAHALGKHEYMRELKSMIYGCAMEMNKVLIIYGHFYNEYGFL